MESEAKKIVYGRSLFNIRSLNYESTVPTYTIYIDIGNLEKVGRKDVNQFIAHV